MTRTFIAALLLLLTAPIARAQPADDPSAVRTDELAVAIAFASSNVGPDLGGAVSVRFARGASKRLAWFVRAELVSNLRRPYGQLLKGGAAAADVGIELATPLGPVLLLTELAVGPRLFMEPGVGVAARIGVGLAFPLGPVRQAGRGRFRGRGVRKCRRRRLWDGSSSASRPVDASRLAVVMFPLPPTPPPPPPPAESANDLAKLRSSD